jgi:hypothetical protein
MVISSTTGAQAEHRGAHAHPDDRVLGDRGVSHAPVAEVGEQSVGDLEGAVEDADVLAHEDHRLVALHLLAQRLVERLAVAHHRHRQVSSCCAASAGFSSSGSSLAAWAAASS